MKVHRSIPFISRVFLGLAALSVVSLAGGTPGLAQAQTEKPSPTPSASPCRSAAGSRSAPAFCGPGFNHQGVHLEITAMTPIVTPDTTELTVNALLEVNSDYHQASQGTLSLEVSTQTPITREELNQWMDARDNDARLQRNLQTVSTQQITHLTADKPQQVTLRVPVTDLPLGGSDRWGPRPLTLTFTPDSATAGTDKASDADVSHSAQDRSFLLWDSGAAFEPSELLAFVPLTTTKADILASTWPLPNLAEVSSTRMQTVCELATATGLTPVFDPLLLEPELNGINDTANLLNLENGPTQPAAETPHPTPTQPSVANSLAGGLCGKQPIAYLPPGDFAAANTSWLDDSSRSRLDKAAADLAEKVSEKLPDYRANLLLWPDFSQKYKPSGDVAGENLLWGADRPMILSPDSGFSDDLRHLSYDPDSRRLINFVGRHEEMAIQSLGWTLDAQLSRLLNGLPASDPADQTGTASTNKIAANASGITPAGGADSPTELSPVAARQWALAQTAVLTRQRPFAPRLFAAGAKRDYSANAAQKAVMEGLTQARWLTFPAWNTVRPDSPKVAGKTPANPVTVTVPDPYPAPTDPSIFTSGSTNPDPKRNLSSVIWYSNPSIAAANNLKAAEALSATMADPQRFQLMFDALQVASNCASCAGSAPDGLIWATGTTAEKQTAIEHARHPQNPADLDIVPNTLDPDVSTALLGLVQAQPASVINLIDKSARLPISVSNGWDQAVSVRLKLTPTDTRLQFDPVETLTIAPHSIGQFRIPVKAVGSGDVQVTVQLTNPAGQSIGAAETIQVRVRAEWESTGTYIVAGLLAAVLVFGIVRRIVKGPKNRKLKTGDRRE